MKLIIDIPDNIYDTIEGDQMISREQLSVLQMKILRGTPYEERPQGEWKSEGYFVFCDYCGSSNGNNKTPFCPYCGAEMRGDKNDNKV